MVVFTDVIWYLKALRAKVLTIFADSIFWKN